MFGSSSRFSTQTGVVDTLCQKLGWSIDERDGDIITLWFNGDHISPRREVMVTHGNGDELMTLGCISRAVFPSSAIPDGLMPALLIRNRTVFTGWYALELRSGNIGFACKFSTLAAGMTPDLFRLICSKLIAEVTEIEHSLHRKRLI